jgi:hypothetical protein
MLDSIVELAFGDLIPVPSIEEVDVDPSFIPSKAKRWAEFTNWYIGPEKIGNKNRSDENPYSPARRLFAIWEKSVVRKSKIVLGQLFGVKSITDDPRTASLRAPLDQPLPSSSTTGKPATMVRRMTNNLPSMINETIVLGNYLDFVNTRTGFSLRIDVFSEYVTAITSSRYASVMRCIWPTAPPTQSLQFFLPRMGLIIPKPESHSLYLKLYASRKPDGYTIRDILKWYSPEELDEDDQAMIKAEQRGKKFEEYVIWLSKEGERRTQNREQMLEEDTLGAKFRLMQNKVARTLGAIRGNPGYSAFSLIPTVPADLRFLEDERVFLDGDGTNNEDEVFDIKESLERSAIEGVQELAMKKKKMLEDQKKAEEAEKQRLEKRERGKRINEGTVRRRQVRAKLALLKEERELFRLVEAREKAAAEELEQQRIAEENAIRKLQDAKRFDEDTQRRELVEMANEEARQRLVERTIENQIGMIREDRMSQLREDREKKREKYKHRRTKHLRELYAPVQLFSPEVAYREPVERQMDDIPTAIWDITDEAVEHNKKHLVLRCEQDPSAPTTLSGVDISAMKRNQRGKLLVEKKRKQIAIRGDPKPRHRTISPERILFEGAEPAHGLQESKNMEYLENFQLHMWIPEASTPTLEPAAISSRLMAEVELEPRPSPWHDRPNSNPESRGDSKGEHLHLPALPLTRRITNRPSSNPASTHEHLTNPVAFPSLIESTNAEDIVPDRCVPPKSQAPSKKLNIASQSDLTFAISKDINGLQNRKMLLSASLASLDKKKIPTEISKRRREDRLRLENRYVVAAVAKDKKEVTAYLSQSLSSDALDDKFYLMASEPVNREADSITNSNKESIQAFRDELFKNLAEFENDDSSKSAAIPQVLSTMGSSVDPIVWATNSVVSSGPYIAAPTVAAPPPVKELQEFDDDADSVKSKACDFYASSSISHQATAPTTSAPTVEISLARSSKGRGAASRTLPSISSEMAAAKTLSSMRQIDIPPPYYRPTFGILGKKKSMVVKITAPTTLDRNDEASIGSASLDL